MFCQELEVYVSVMVMVKAENNDNIDDVDVY